MKKSKTTSAKKPKMPDSMTTKAGAKPVGKKVMKPKAKKG